MLRFVLVTPWLVAEPEPEPVDEPEDDEDDEDADDEADAGVALGVTPLAVLPALAMTKVSLPERDKKGEEIGKTRTRVRRGVSRGCAYD